MKYDFQKLKKKSNHDIFLELTFLSSFKTKYEYLKLTEEEFYNICVLEIEKSKTEFDNKTYYYNYISDMINKSFNDLCLIKIKENPKEVINNYIDFNLPFKRSYSYCINKINNLYEFINKNIKDFDLSILLELINTNKNLNKILEFVFVNDQLKLTLKEPEEIYSSSVLNFILLYCDSKDIDLYDLYDQEKESKETNIKTIYNLSLLAKDYPLLSKEQEKEYSIRVKQGDKKAEEIFILSNQKLVMKIAARYESKTSSLALEDLYQEGNIGLMSAIYRFDETKDFRFSTYATWWIRQAIERAILDKDLKIRKPVHTNEKIYRIKKAEEELLYELNREPTFKEISDKVNLSEQYVKDLLSAPVVTTSLDMNLKDDSDTDYHTILEDPNSNFIEELEEKFAKEELNKLFKKVGLKQKEIDVLTLRFGLSNQEPMTLEKIGQLFGVTRERIRQIESRAIRQIRKSRYVKEFSDYMDDSNQALVNVKEMRKLAYSEPKAYHNYKKNNFKTEKKDINLTFYDLYKDFTKEEVDNILRNLDHSCKLLIYKKYDISLNKRKKAFEFTEKEKEDYKELLIQIYEVLKQGDKKISTEVENENMRGVHKNANTIFEYFKDYDKDDLKKVIDSLNEEYKALLNKKFGEDLENPNPKEELTKEETKKYYHCVLRTIRYRLERNSVVNFSNKEDEKITPSIKDEKKRTIKTVYEYFEEYTKEEVDSVINNLPADLKEIVYKRYENNLENKFANNILTKQEYRKFYQTILKKIERNLKDLKVGTVNYKFKNIYSLLEEYTKEEIDEVIKNLSDNDKELLYKKFGDDLENPNPKGELTKAEYKRFYNSLLRRMQIKLFNKRNKIVPKKGRKFVNQNKQVIESTVEVKIEEPLKKISDIDDSNANFYLKIFDIIKVMGYEKLIEGLSPIEIVVVLLKFGFVNNVSFDNERLVKFLNVSEEEIEKITKNIIENNRENVSKFVDDALTNIINNPSAYLKK